MAKSGGKDSSTSMSKSTAAGRRNRSRLAQTIRSDRQADSFPFGNN